MNTGPIIGGTRDGEQFSHTDKFGQLPARLLISAIAPSDLKTVAPMDDMITETLRWVPFFFSFPYDRDVKTGFWVSLGEETQRFSEDAEFRLFVLTKLSARYIENSEAIEKRLRDRFRSGRQ